MLCLQVKTGNYPKKYRDDYLYHFFYDSYANNGSGAWAVGSYYRS